MCVWMYGCMYVRNWLSHEIVNASIEVHLFTINLLKQIYHLLIGKYYTILY